MSNIHINYVQRFMNIEVMNNDFSLVRLIKQDSLQGDDQNSAGVGQPG